MQHFRNRNDLVEWLETQPLRGTIARALQEGTTEVVGGFYLIPPTNLSGWIVKVTSIHKRIWNLAIVISGKKYGIHVVNEIPWKYWSGGNTINTLYTGDNPDEYRRLKECQK
jgi:hypothetical protein